MIVPLAVAGPRTSRESASTSTASLVSVKVDPQGADTFFTSTGRNCDPLSLNVQVALVGVQVNPAGQLTASVTEALASVPPDTVGSLGQTTSTSVRASRRWKGTPVLLTSVM